MPRLLDKSVLHLADDLVEKEIRQMRMNDGPEFEGERKVYDARVRIVLQARREDPHGVEVIEEFAVRAFRLYELRMYHRHLRRVTLVQRWKSDDQIGVQGILLATYYIRPFAERHELLVIADVGHHGVDLFHGEPRTSMNCQLIKFKMERNIFSIRLTLSIFCPRILWFCSCPKKYCISVARNAALVIEMSFVRWRKHICKRKILINRLIS